MVLEESVKIDYQKEPAFAQRNSSSPWMKLWTPPDLVGCSCFPPVATIGQGAQGSKAHLESWSGKGHLQPCGPVFASRKPQPTSNLSALICRRKQGSGALGSTTQAPRPPPAGRWCFTNASTANQHEIRGETMFPAAK